MDSNSNELSSTVSCRKYVCVNLKCNSNTPLISGKVPRYVLTHFGVDKAEHQRVCERCLDNAFYSFEKKRKNKKNKKLLFDIDIEIPAHRKKRKISKKKKVNLKVNRKLTWYTDSEMRTWLEEVDDDIKNFRKMLDEVDIQCAENVNCVAMNNNDMQLYTSRVIPSCGILSRKEKMSALEVTEETDVEIIPDDIMSTSKSGYTEIRPRINVGNVVHVMRRGSNFLWEKGTILAAENRITRKEFGKYKVECDKTSNIICVEGRCIAYPVEPDRWLPNVGFRVIGKLDQYHTDSSKAFYSGTIAEPPSIKNKFRYLIFFDNGRNEYVTHDDIRLICEQSSEPHADVPVEHKKFLYKYLKDYPHRNIVKLALNSKIIAKRRDSWLPAKVKRIDVSLVEILFDGFIRTEWVYRGSPRLIRMFDAVRQNPQKRCVSSESIRKENARLVAEVLFQQNSLMSKTDVKLSTVPDEMEESGTEIKNIIEDGT